MPDRFDPVSLRRAAAAYLDTHPDALVQTPPAPPTSRSHTPIHWALGGMVGGQMADALSTHAALQRGAVERNPLYGDHPSLGRILATKGAITTPIAILLDKMYNAHPKAALGLALGLGAFGGGLAVHNSRQGRK